MAYLGLVPCEHSSGARLRRGGQTGLTPDHPEPFDQDIGNEQIPNGLP
jgi:hypothetical protein